jgi:hypothetical protein
MEHKEINFIVAGTSEGKLSVDGSANGVHVTYNGVTVYSGIRVHTYVILNKADAVTLATDILKYAANITE